MACGHPEIGNLPVLSNYAIKDDSICLLLEELGVDTPIGCSGEICGVCKVEWGDILDGLVVDVERVEPDPEGEPMMAGALNADMDRENYDRSICSVEYTVMRLRQIREHSH
jgi:hypothetical protein